MTAETRQTMAANKTWIDIQNNGSVIVPEEHQIRFQTIDGSVNFMIDIKWANRRRHAAELSAALIKWRYLLRKKETMIEKNVAYTEIILLS